MIIHQIWLSDIIPDHILKWMSGWESITGHEYRLWRGSDCNQYLPYLRRAAITKLPPALQADLLRLLILRDCGGLYVDCDVELTGRIPAILPDGMAGIWCGGCDPYLLHARTPGNAAVVAMIQHGFNQSICTPEIHRWGFKAYHAVWAGVAMECSAWSVHHSQHSWGTGHQSQPRVIPPIKIH